MEDKKANCQCVVKNRLPEESQREWFKRWMCQWHWMETDYYQRKLEEEDRRFPLRSAATTKD
jgi:hypothetical protein